MREALAARGHVRFDVSAAGSLLERGLFDWSVHQPERIDYAAPPVCEDGIEAFGREIRYVGRDRDILPSGDWTIPREMKQAAERNRAVARAESEPEARARREARIDAEVRRIVEKDATVPTEAARERARAAFERDDLHSDFPIVIIEDGHERIVMVREICAERERYHETETLDPLEPEYRERKVVGIVFANPDGSTVLHSQAHGGRTYRLHGRPMLILREGRMHEAVEDAVRMMAASGRFFALGGSVAIVGKGGAAMISDSGPHLLRGVALAHEIERQFDVLSYRRPRGRPSSNASDSDARLVPSNLPREFADRIATNTNLTAQLPTLIGVRSDPLIWPDGRYCDAEGYDTLSHLWFSCKGTIEVPIAPTDTDVREAYEVLTRPFTQYRFASERDRSAMLLLMLTAICRPTLPLAPAFAVVAPQRGSGKTRLATCAATLAGRFELVDLGIEGAEASKRIDTFLRGGADCLLLDNLTTGEELDRSTVAAMLTAPEMSVRPMGQNSGLVEVSTCRLIVATANNPRITGDAVRRVLTVRIEPTSAAPHLDTFGFDPVEMTRTNRRVMVRAGLVLLRAGIGTPAGATLGSFEVWADFTGGALERCVLAGVEGLASFGAVLAGAVGEDPTATAINSLVDLLPEMTHPGITVAAIGSKATDAFGRRSPDRQSAELAVALDALAAGERRPVWTATGTFNVQGAGRLFASLNGRLFVRGNVTWRVRYTGGRGAMVRCEVAEA